MSPGRPGPRNAVAGLALAAAGVLYRRLTGRQPAPLDETPSLADPQPGRADDAEVARARRELADELARRASRSDR
jgi:hypothetical protein